ncbi:MAG: hypothetical protein GQ475_03320 [Methylococcaceae bacterium]|nr:hypothetical protein [Methylococcaceae bacterium]
MKTTLSDIYIANHKPDISQWLTKYQQHHCHTYNVLGLGAYRVNKLIEVHRRNFNCEMLVIEYLWVVILQLCIPMIEVGNKQ